MRPEDMHKPRTEQQFWAIKTTAGGPQFHDHWDDFRNRRDPQGTTVAVGWPDVEEDPRDFSEYQDFLKCVNAVYPEDLERSNAVAARTIYGFAHAWRSGDVAVVCVGYNGRQGQHVFLYGFAIVGEFLFDLNTEWEWLFKRKAQLCVIEKEVPVDIFREAFGGSMIGTINGPFPRDSFLQFSKSIQKLYPNKWRGLTDGKKVTFRR